MPKFVHIIWNGTQQHSVVAASAIVSGTLQAGEEVGAKWWGKTYSATVLAADTIIFHMIYHHMCKLVAYAVATYIIYC